MANFKRLNRPNEPTEPKGLDRFDQFEPASFNLPPMLTGLYVLFDTYGSEHRYHFRRIPRATKFTGRFGLFYHDPDAHWQLLAVWDHKQVEWETVPGLPTEVSKRIKLFTEPLTDENSPKLVEHRCAWCGKRMPIENDRFTHESTACNREPNPEGEVVEGECNNDTPADYVHGSGIVGDSRKYLGKLPFLGESG